MASVGTHKVPKETKNESRWFKFFTLGQLIACGAVLMLDVGIVKFFSGFGIAIVGVFFAFAISLIMGVIIMARMPYSKYLLGAGLPIYIIVLRLILHKIIHKYLYLRNYDSEGNE